MAIKKSAPAKKAAPKKVATKKTIKPVQGSTATEEKPNQCIGGLPLDALKGIVNSAEEITVGATKDKIVDILVDFTPTQCKEILEDVRKELQREFEDQATELQRQAESIRNQMMY